MSYIYIAVLLAGYALESVIFKAYAVNRCKIRMAFEFPTAVQPSVALLINLRHGRMAEGGKKTKLGRQTIWCTNQVMAGNEITIAANPGT